MYEELLFGAFSIRYFWFQLWSFIKKYWSGKFDYLASLIKIFEYQVKFGNLQLELIDWMVWVV